MTSQLIQLNEAQALIYSRSNIRRAFPAFDDTDIAGIFKQDDKIVVTRNDGSQRSYPADQIRTAFKTFTSRTPDFFSYLGPNYRGPSIWKNNCYILFKGWLYSKQGAESTFQVKAQHRWADRFAVLSSEQQLIDTLNRFDLGYLLSPDGRINARKETLGDDEEQDIPEPEPFCSCGSFQRQLRVLPELQQEIPGYQPICKHIAYHQRFREYCTKRSALINNSRGNVPQQCTAWHYTPPAIGEDKGRFQIIYTREGQNAPLNKWSWYKKDKHYSQSDAWGLFDSMLENGFVPFPITSLSHISHFFKAN